MVLEELKIEEHIGITFNSKCQLRLDSWMNLKNGIKRKNRAHDLVSARILF